MNSHEAARQYLTRGWRPVPVPRGSKNPGFNDWQHFSCTADEVSRHFSRVGNIGLLLGKPSRGLGDVDCDISEARALAAHFLKAGLRSGHPNNPDSHYWSIVTPSDFRTKQFF